MSEDRPVQLQVKVERELHHAAKVEAARRGVTLADVVREALQRFVKSKSK